MGAILGRYAAPDGSVKWIELACDADGHLTVGSGTKATPLLTAATAPGPSATQPCRQGATFHATGQTTAGAGQAVIDIEVSNDGANWLPHDTITLTLSTTLAQAGIELDASWVGVRGNLRSISGTGASASLTMGA